MTTQRVSLITLSVADLNRAKTFYAALGWVPHPGPEGVAFYQANGFILGLYPRDALAEEIGRPPESLGTGAMTLAINFGAEAEVDAFHARALAAGATRVTDPTPTFWGGYSGYIADPDGHLWEVAMNPFWTLAEDGTVSL